MIAVSVAPADGWCHLHRRPVTVERPLGVTATGVPITEWVCRKCARLDRKKDRRVVQG